MSLLEAFRARAAEAQYTFQPSGTTIFDVATAQPDVARALFDANPGLAEIVEALRKTLAVPPTALPTTAPSKDLHFYRLSNHNRSYCYSLSASSEPSAIYAAPTLVVKGAEPLQPDFARFVEWMKLAPFRQSKRRLADHFPLAEGKIPGATTVHEVVREARIASDLQAHHLRVYGELGPLPVPILGIRLPDDVTQNALRVLRTLSKPAVERIESIAREGLGVYVYHYRRAPIRSNVFGGGGTKALVSYVAQAFNHETALRGWVQAFVRLLFLGFLPYTEWNEGLGFCLDFGNATIDGGFCDVDSITPIADVPDDAFFFKSLEEAARLLHDTCARLLDDEPNPARQLALARYLGSLFERAIESEKRPGVTLDPRVRQLLQPTFQDLSAAALAPHRSPGAYQAFVRSRR